MSRLRAAFGWNAGKQGAAPGWRIQAFRYELAGAWAGRARLQPSAGVSRRSRPRQSARDLPQQRGRPRRSHGIQLTASEEFSFDLELGLTADQSQVGRPAQREWRGYGLRPETNRQGSQHRPVAELG